MPYIALRKLLRIEWTLKRVVVSPHWSTTSPPLMIITAAVGMVWEYSRAALRPAGDQPARAISGTRSQAAPGKADPCAAEYCDSAAAIVRTTAETVMITAKRRIFSLIDV